MNYFKTLTAAETYCERNGLPTAAIYSDFVMGEAGMVYVVQLP